MNVIKEFKEFAVKGNMFDMAIGIIIGTAFSKIVTSLVDDLIMPVLSIIIGKINFQDLSFILREEVQKDGIVTQSSITLAYGNFLQTSIDFLIIALSIFIVIKILNKLRAKSEDEKNHAEPTPKNIQLLAEIRDLLKDQKKN